MLESLQLLSRKVRKMIYRSNGVYMHTLGLGSAIALPNGIETKINFAIPQLDSHAAVTNPTTNFRWTCPPDEGGIYMVQAQLFLAAGTATDFRVHFKINGGLASAGITGPNGAIDYVQGRNTGLLSLAPGDFVEIYAMQFGPASRDIHPDGTFTNLQIFRIGGRWPY